MFVRRAKVYMVTHLCQMVPGRRLSLLSCSRWTLRQVSQTSPQTWYFLCILQGRKREKKLTLVNMLIIWHPRPDAKPTLDEIQGLVFCSCDVFLSPGWRTTGLIMLYQEVWAADLEEWEASEKRMMWMEYNLGRIGPQPATRCHCSAGAGRSKNLPNFFVLFFFISWIIYKSKSLMITLSGSPWPSPTGRSHWLALVMWLK